MVELGPELTAVPTPGHYPMLFLGVGRLLFLGQRKPSEMPACCFPFCNLYLMQRRSLRCYQVRAEGGLVVRGGRLDQAEGQGRRR